MFDIPLNIELIEVVGKMQKKHTNPEQEGANIRAALRDDPVQMYLNDIGNIP